MIGINPILFDRFKISGIAANGNMFEDVYPTRIKMPRSVELNIGFDQSTSQTGLAVKTVDGKLVCILDFINRDLPNNNIYSVMLQETLRTMFEGCKIENLILEKPFGGKNKRTAGTLEALRSFMFGLKYVIPEYNSANFDDIPPGTWRKEFLDKKKYKGRFTRDKVKIAAAEECCERYPILKKYWILSKKEMDSFDALGILDGWLAANYNQFGMKKVNRSMNLEFRHSKIYNIDDFYTETWAEEVSSKYKSILRERGYQLIEYNPSLDLDENVARMTSSTNKVSLTIIPKGKEYILLNWEKGKVISPNKIYVLSAYRENIHEGLE